MSEIAVKSSVSPQVAKMKSIVSSETIKNKLQDMLGEERSVFLASVLDLYTNDAYLSECDPMAVMTEAIKCAALKLPLTKALGFGYIVAYKRKPTFLIGYKGLIQLAIRTGQYETINAGTVYEGQTVKQDVLTGETHFYGEPTSDKAIGYFAYFKLLNGFNKCMYWSVDRVRSHAEKRSASYNFANSPWKTDFDAMAQKTMLRMLLSKYGYMSIDMRNMMAQEADAEAAAEVSANANKEPIQIDDKTVVDSVTGEVASSANVAAIPADEDPGF